MKKLTTIILIFFLLFVVQSHAEQFSSKSCYGPTSDEFKLCTRGQASSFVPWIGEMIKAYDKGKEFELSGDMEKAAIMYMAISASMSASIGVSPNFIKAAVFDLDCGMHIPRQYPLDLRPFCLSTMDTYSIFHNFGQNIMLNKLRNELDKFETKATLSKKHTDLMIDLLNYDKVLIIKDQGFVHLGKKQVYHFVEWMLDNGVVFKDGKWSELSQSEMPPDSAWQIETRGPVKGMAYRLDSSRSFLPGCLLLKKVSNSSLSAKTFQQLMGENCWEFCLIDTGWDDVRSAAFKYCDLGWIFEASKKNQQAVEAYGFAMKTFGVDFTEPMLAYERLGVFKQMDSESSNGLESIVDIVKSHIMLLETIQGDFKKRGASRETNKAAMRVCYLLKSILLGRLSASDAKDLLTDEYKPGNRKLIIGKGSINTFYYGMKDQGVKISDHWRFKKLSSSDWSSNPKKIEFGYFRGCYQDSKGNLMVPGLKRL